MFRQTAYWAVLRDRSTKKKMKKYLISALDRIVFERILLSNWLEGGIYYVINSVAKILCQYCDISLPREDLHRLRRYMHPISEQSAF